MDDTPTHTEWQRWLHEHAPKLMIFARQQARCETDAQDLVQEALVEAWQRQNDGQLPAPPLVFATIRRRAVDLARSADRRAHREQAVAGAEMEPWFDPSLEDREMSQIVQQALGQLPTAQRDVITLKVWGGLTFAEIATALDIPPNTAASRYRYGLEELRKLTKGVLTS